MIKQTELEGLSRRRHGGVFQTVLSLSLSQVGCLVFNFQDRALNENPAAPACVPFPGWQRRLWLPGLPVVEPLHLCTAVLCVGKDFKKQLTK